MATHFGRLMQSSAKRSFRLLLAMLILSGGAAVAYADDQPDVIAAGQIARAILAQPGDATYGEYLATECNTCHEHPAPATGNTPPVPPIAGLPTDYLVQALVEYRMDVRHNDVMRLVTARLSNEQIAALAAYFAQQRPGAKD